MKYTGVFSLFLAGHVLCFSARSLAGTAGPIFTICWLGQIVFVTSKLPSKSHFYFPNTEPPAESIFLASLPITNAERRKSREDFLYIDRIIKLNISSKRSPNDRKRFSANLRLSKLQITCKYHYVWNRHSVIGH